MSKNSQTKKLLLLNYEFPPLGGGAANATHYLLKEYAKDPNLEVDLVTSSTDKDQTVQFAPNIKIHYLDIGKKGNYHYQTNKDLLTYSYKAYRYSKKIKKAKQIDLVHAFFGIPCGYIAMKLKLPYIVSLRGSDVPFYNKRFYWLDKLIFKRLSKKIWKKAEKVVANSQDLKDLAKQSAPNQEISVIYNGVDTEEFHPAKQKPQNKKLHLVSTGRLIERKGYKYLIEAIKDLDVELTLIGDGDLKDELKQLAKESKARVNFAGNVAHDNLLGYLQKADVFVLPSLNEGMSNAILEAMAAGLPIVSTDTGGSAELVKHNGFIVPKKDSKVLKHALSKFINDKTLAEKMGKKSRQMAEEMSWGNIAKEYKDTYAKLA